MRLCEVPTARSRGRSAAVHRSSALATWLAAVAILLASHSAAGEAIPSPQVRFGTCQREGGKFVGQRPVRVGGKVRPPKKLHDVRPKYPDFPAGTTGRGNWAGEALIDTNGNVVGVWSIREVEITPPLPAFNKAIVDAIRQWRFEPVRVKDQPVPVCMTVTVNINWS